MYQIIKRFVSACKIIQIVLRNGNKLPHQFQILNWNYEIYMYYTCTYVFASTCICTYKFMYKYIQISDISYKLKSQYFQSCKSILLCTFSKTCNKWKNMCLKLESTSVRDYQLFSTLFLSTKEFLKGRRTVLLWLLTLLSHWGEYKHDGLWLNTSPY